MKIKIIALIISLIMLFPAPAHAVAGFDDILLAITKMQEQLQPLMTIVQQGMQNLQMLQQSNNIMTQVQAAMRTVQDITVFNAQRQNGATADQYMEYTDYINAQRENNRRLAQIFRGYALLATLLMMDDQGNIQLIGWEDIDSLLSIVSVMDSNTFNQLSNINFENIDYSLTVYENAENSIYNQKSQELKTNYDHYMAGNSITNASSASISATVQYSYIKYAATQTDMENANKVQIAKILHIRKTIFAIRQVVYLYKNKQYDKAISKSKEVVKSQEDAISGKPTLDKALGITP